LFIALTLVSGAPVLNLAAWQQQQSLIHEIASLREKHLLLAGNIAAALDWYIMKPMDIDYLAGIMRQTMEKFDG